jgi:hypothetical protein
MNEAGIMAAEGEIIRQSGKFELLTWIIHESRLLYMRGVGP